jgi:hypothetical protein
MLVAIFCTALIASETSSSQGALLPEGASARAAAQDVAREQRLPLSDLQWANGAALTPVHAYSATSSADRAAQEDSLRPAYTISMTVIALAMVAFVVARELSECRATNSRFVVACSHTLGWDLRYLVPYGLLASTDWLQGPYVYDLYAGYGYSSNMIKVLFVVGFSSALVSGPFVGAIAGRFGLKQMVLAGYCLTYLLAVVTKHFGDSLGLLVIGRILGGLATSVLFSCFEAWLVAEYAHNGYSAVTIGIALSHMYVVNGLCAVAVGPLAQAGADAGPLTNVGGSGFYVRRAPPPSALCPPPLRTPPLRTPPSTIPLPSTIPFRPSPSAFHTPPLPPHTHDTSACSSQVGGDTVPFDLSAATLILGGGLVAVLWAEHTPSASSSGSGDGKGSSGSAGAARGGESCMGGVYTALAWLLSSPAALLLMAGSAATEVC